MPGINIQNPLVSVNKTPLRSLNDAVKLFGQVSKVNIADEFAFCKQSGEKCVTRKWSNLMIVCQRIKRALPHFPTKVPNEIIRKNFVSQAVNNTIKALEKY